MLLSSVEHQETSFLHSYLLKQYPSLFSSSETHNYFVVINSTGRDGPRIKWFFMLPLPSVLQWFVNSRCMHDTMTAYSEKHDMILNILCFVLTLSLYSLVRCSDNSTTESLDVSLQVLAFKTLVHHHHHTGAVYRAMLPKNMSGMDASIVRIRSRRLWNRGLNVSYIHIPSRTISVPHARRLAIVYEDFGNWSSQYYAVPGYSLVTSVVGFVVYDASDVENSSIRKLRLNLMGKKPISVHFPNLTFSSGSGLMAKSRCVAFKSNGTVSLTKMSPANTCQFQDQAHFSLIVPLEEKQKHRKLWLIGLVLGCILLPVAAYIVVGFLKLMRSKKIQVMEKQADEDMVLETRWVGHSKMPSATVSRTQPNLEDGGVL